MFYCVNLHILIGSPIPILFFIWACPNQSISSGHWQEKIIVYSDCKNLVWILSGQQSVFQYTLFHYPISCWGSNELSFFYMCMHQPVNFIGSPTRKNYGILGHQSFFQYTLFHYPISCWAPMRFHIFICARTNQSISLDHWWRKWWYILIIRTWCEFCWGTDKFSVYTHFYYPISCWSSNVLYIFHLGGPVFVYL